MDRESRAMAYLEAYTSEWDQIPECRADSILRDVAHRLVVGFGIHPADALPWLVEFARSTGIERAESDLERLLIEFSPWGSP